MTKTCPYCGKEFSKVKQWLEHMETDEKGRREKEQQEASPGAALNFTMSQADEDELRIINQIDERKEIAKETAQEIGRRILGEDKSDRGVISQIFQGKKDKPKEEVKSTSGSISQIADRLLAPILAAIVPAVLSILGRISGVFTTTTTLYMIASGAALALGLFFKGKRMSSFGTLFIFIGVIGLIAVPTLFINVRTVAAAAGLDIPEGNLPTNAFEGITEGAGTALCLLTNPTGCAEKLTQTNQTEKNAVQSGVHDIVINKFIVSPEKDIRPGTNFRLEMEIENKGKFPAYTSTFLNYSKELTDAISTGKIIKDSRSCENSVDENFHVCEYVIEPSKEQLYWEYRVDEQTIQSNYKVRAILDYNYTVEAKLSVEAYPTFQTRKPVGSEATSGSAKLSVGVGDQPMKANENRILSIVIRNNNPGILFGDTDRDPLKIVASIPTNVFDTTNFNPDKCFIAPAVSSSKTFGDCEPKSALTKCLIITIPVHNMSKTDQLSISCNIKVNPSLNARATGAIVSTLDYWYQYQSPERTIMVKP